MNSAELRERLKAEAGSLDPRYTAAPDLMREAAAALERLEALEAALRTLVDRRGMYNLDDGHDVMCDALDGDDCTCGIDDARALLATPAPAGQQGGSDE